MVIDSRSEKEDMCTTYKDPHTEKDTVPLEKDLLPPATPNRRCRFGLPGILVGAFEHQ